MEIIAPTLALIFMAVVMICVAKETRRENRLFAEAARKNKENENYDGIGPPPPQHVVK